LNGEESFWLARRRVGQPQQLEEEFVKADPIKAWRERAFWMTAAILIFSSWQPISRSLLIIRTAPFHPGMPYAQFQTGFFQICMDLSFKSLPVILPIALLLGLIARSRTIARSAFLSSLFYSRVRLGAATLVFVAALFFLQAWSNFHMTGMLTGFPVPGDVSLQTWLNTFPDTIIRLVLVGLLVWFMPVQNRKTPKHA
jgi:hypothetical protein